MSSLGPRLAAVVVLTCAVASCGAAHDTSTVIVGATSDDRGELLAHIYAGALSSAGVQTEVRVDWAERTDVLAELDAGDVAVVPDLTGALLTTFDAQSGATEAEDVFVDLNRSLPEGLSVGDYALADDRTAVAVSPSSDIASLSDFAPNCATTLAGVVDSPDGPDVLEAGMQLSMGYSCNIPEFMVYPDARSAVDALESGEVGALLFRTASFGPLAADLTALEDDKSALRAQNVVPLLRTGVLDDSATATLAVVAGELTTSDLADMIGEVRDGADSGDVAARWLGERTV